MGPAVFTLLLGVVVWLGYSVARRITGMTGPTPRHMYRDFFEFFSGAEAMLQGKDIYEAGALGYIYPPLLAFLLMPIATLGLPAAAWAWLGVQVVVYTAALWLGAKEIHRRFGLPLDALSVCGLILLALLLNIDKLRSELNMQQSNGILLLSFVLGLKWLDRRPVLCGLALAFGANLKYLTLIALPYLLIRRRWKAAGSLVVGTVAFALLPALYLGWETNLEYISRAFGGLGHLVSDVETGDASAKVFDADFGLSVPAFAARFFGEAGQTTISLGFVLLVGGVYCAAAWAIYLKRRTPLLAKRGGDAERREPAPGIVAIEWAGLMILALAFSPQTNSRHFVILLLPGMVAVALLSVHKHRASAWPLIIGCVVLVAGMSLPPGGQASEAAVDRWRSVSGSTWCMLFWYLTILWTGLGRVGWHRESATS